MLVFEVEATTRSRILNSFATLRLRESLFFGCVLESGCGNVSAASVGRDQQHAVAGDQSRLQVASECRSVDMQQPARRVFAIHDAKLGE